MTSLFRKFTWWVHRRRREHELDEELQFHLEEERDERRASGLPASQAAWAARRDLGNVTLLREDARALGHGDFARCQQRLFLAARCR